MIAAVVAVSWFPPTPFLVAQELPAIRQIGPIVNRSTFTVRSIAATRQLPTGKVLVNDMLSRRLYLVDSALVSAIVVLDSTSRAINSYGDSPGGIVPYKADSTLFIDPSSASILVIDPMARVARVMAGPQPSDFPFLLGGPYGTPGFDAKGRLVFRGSAHRTPQKTVEVKAEALTDSAPIVRLDLNSRKMDTVAQFRVARSVLSATQTQEGKFKARVLKNPMPVVDDWVVLADGSVAVVRGKNFQLDFITAEARGTPSRKISFPWKRLSENDKAAFADSVRNVTDSISAKTRAAIAARVKDSDMRPEPVEFDYISPSEFPDYMPAFEVGAARAGPSGELWIRTTEVSAGKPVYYVVSNTGVLVDRVQLPSGRIIAGFGRDETVYLAFIDASGGVRLERARIH